MTGKVSPRLPATGFLETLCLALCLGALALPEATAGGGAVANSGTKTGRDPVPVVFDTDMAIDDWAALLFLQRHPGIELRALTVAGSGEAHCGPGMRNALALLDLAQPGNDVPVACGDPVPLDGYFVFPKAWQDDMDRLGGVPIAASGRLPSSRHAVDLLHEAVARSDEPLVVLATGPLTNIAQWLARFPDDRSRVERLVIMGGNVSTPGNIIVPGFTDDHPNTRAEWNLFIDPVAADEVLSSGLPMELVGLDVTNQVRVTRAFAREFKQRARHSAAHFWDAVLDANEWFIDSGEYYFWDVLAAIAILDRERFCRGTRHTLSVGYEEAGTSPYLGTSDATMPTTTWRGAPRRHLNAATAGVIRVEDDLGSVLVCRETDASGAFDLFLDVVAGP